MVVVGPKKEQGYILKKEGPRRDLYIYIYIYINLLT